MTNQLSKFYLSVSVGILGSCIASLPQALAQQAAQTGEEAEGTTRLEEIVVTAEKVQRNLQRVPVTVKAFDAEALDVNRIYEVEDVARFTPGFSTRISSPSNPEFVIRGIGTDALTELGIEQSVIVYIDDVPILRSGGANLNLFDLERVEVLKGPQGTLFGRNAVGGAIRLVTAKPGNERRIKAEVTVGDFDLIETRGVISEPISDYVSAKISWSTADRDGFNVNRVTGNRTDDVNEANVRAQLRIAPSSELDILLTGDFSTDKVNGIHRTVLPGGLSTSTGFVPDPNLRIGAVNSTAVQGFESLDGFFDRENWGVAGHVTWDTSIGTLSTITSLRHLEFRVSRDFGNIPNSETPDVCARGVGVCRVKSVNNADESGETLTNEVRLHSTDELFGNPLEWTVGTFFVHEDVERIQIRDREVFGTESLPAFIQDAQTNGVSLFGNAAWTLAEGLTLSYGVRWSRDKKRFHMRVEDFSNGERPALNPAVEEFVVEQLEESFDKISTNVTLDYAVTDDHFVFFTARRGFKSGGFNGFAGDEIGARIVARPETAWNYEFGFKTEWFDNTLRLNTSVFWIEFDNLQREQQVELVPGDISTRTVALVNAASARIRGIETDIDFAPTDWLTLRASHAFLDSRFNEFVIPSEFGVPPGGTPDLAGTTLSRTPENSFTLAADLEFPLSNFGFFGINASYRYESFTFSDVATATISRIDDFGIVDGRVWFETADRHWRLSAWVENLNDELIPTSITPVGGAGLTTVNDDRIFGFTLQYNL